MKKIDFHIHTIKSISDKDFDFDIEKLKEYIKTTKLDAIAITNHNLFDKEQFNNIKEEVEIKGNDYFVKMSIDLTKLGQIKHIKFNAFRIETKGIETNYILQALSPTLSDTFHVREKFIKL